MPYGPSPERLEYASSRWGANPPGPGGTSMGIRNRAAPVLSVTAGSVGGASPGAGMARPTGARHRPHAARIAIPARRCVLRIPARLVLEWSWAEPQWLASAFYRQIPACVNTNYWRRALKPAFPPGKRHPVGIVWQGYRVKWTLIALLSAPLLALAQSPFGLAPVALVALTPWLWASRRAGAGEALALGALVGTLYGCLVAPWIPEALRALGSSGEAALLGLVATAAWAKAPLFAGVGWIAQRLRGQPAGVQIAGVAFALGLGEWAIGVWRLGVPGALVGHTQLAAPGVAQLAVVGGVPLLSTWLVAINAAFALAISQGSPARRLAVAFASSWLAMAGLGLPVAEWVRPRHPEGASAELLIVQPEIPRDARWDARAQPWILESMASHTSAALAGQEGRIDAIVWPENLLTTPLEFDPDLSRALQGHVDQWGVPLITGLVRPSTRGAPREVIATRWSGSCPGAAPSSPWTSSAPSPFSNRAAPSRAQACLLPCSAEPRAGRRCRRRRPLAVRSPRASASPRPSATKCSSRRSWRLVGRRKASRF